MNTNMTTRVAGIFMSLVVLVATWQTACAEAELLSAQDLVQRSTNEMLVLVEQAQAYVDEDPERFYIAVEALLAPVVDFPRFARSVMAVQFKTATIAQRERFTELFKWTLARTYALTLARFKDGAVVMIPAERPPRNANQERVKMEIRMADGSVYPVVYSLGRESDADPWRVRNIIVIGINMGITYRNQFKSAMQNPQYDGDLDQVIESWAGVVTGEEDESEKTDEAPGDVREDTEPTVTNS